MRSNPLTRTSQNVQEFSASGNFCIPTETCKARTYRNLLRRSNPFGPSLCGLARQSCYSGKVIPAVIFPALKSDHAIRGVLCAIPTRP
jgi:hypothetical protein